ncbi:hypothetical protein G7Y79_00013g035130 [Physcia stellaris]|nr:hypothetical protein G7Y79_00013g035130 [Physcia stellaris]
MTITIDTATNIIGHGNTIQLPSPTTTTDRIHSLLEIACRHLPDRSAPDEEAEYGDDGFAPGPMEVEIKVNAGVNICGSKNVVILGGGGGRPGQGVKRKAEGEVADSPQAKKAAVS